MSPLDKINRLQQATVDARARTGDHRIGVQVKAGEYRIVIVDKDNKGAGIETPVSEWGDIDQVIADLGDM